MGERCYRNLEEVSDRLDIVNIFPRVSNISHIVEEAIRIGARVIWMQDGIMHPEAAEKPREHGLKVIMDRCIRVEYIRNFVKVCCP